MQRYSCYFLSLSRSSKSRFPHTAVLVFPFTTRTGSVCPEEASNSLLRNSARFYQTTRRHIPDDLKLHNLKFPVFQKHTRAQGNSQKWQHSERLQKGAVDSACDAVQQQLAALADRDVLRAQPFPSITE
jgi:hypothetical protein